eukprot:GHRQ01017115.1.p1 GENE.GHRQ01017115.1~~GHRQ01017115.1.p1  ORF type:complete len:320 (+),score=122.70 GHRQ01017115.1:241-1200(+)
MQEIQTSSSKCHALVTSSRTVRVRTVRVQAVAATVNNKTVLAPPYNVLITGSTKGVGRALAEDFLEAGDSVIVCARNEDQVQGVVEELQQKYGAKRVVGKACNVSKADQVKSLAEYAQQQLGSIDLWINNAGTNAYKYGPLLESDDEDLEAIVDTNILGVMLCCKEAINRMKEQPAGGHVFNMDGAGADGNATPRFAAYGATKRSLQQLGKSLEAELKMAKINNVGVHNLSPGMVTTELLMSGANTPTAKFFINCLAEEPGDVAAYLVPRIRDVPPKSSTLTGGVASTYIQYLTKPKALSQIFARLLTGARKDRFVKED